MRIAVVTPMMKSGERGGAEALYEGLVANLRAFGYQADQVEVATDESTFDAILESYQRCADLDLSAYDAVLSTKAPTYTVRHPNHVSYLLHTIRVFYDMFEREFGAGTPHHHRQRMVVHALDQAALHPTRVRGHFANGETTFQRLFDADPFWRTVPFRAVHHPPALAGYRPPGPGEYIFLPSRLHRWKRVGLLIDAYKHLDRDVPLKIAGVGEDEPALRELAAGDRRIEFLGRVTDQQVLDLYAGAIAVPFTPRQEDYGLITIEAFRSRKPVLTCTDSGEPVRFVRDYETGFVTPPDPAAIAHKLRYLIDHPAQAAEMGERGHASTSHITWGYVINELLRPILDAPPGRPVAAAGSNGTYHLGNGKGLHPAVNGLHKSDSAAADPAPRSSVATDPPPPAVVVLDMQPITPPIGGGRLRLLGLYHALGMTTSYVGTYDWPGEKYRNQKLSETLTETCVPLSDAHFAAADEWKRRAGGKTTIDVSFDLLAHLSPEYVAEARKQTAGADVVVFSHPWVYPLVKDLLRQRPQLVVYESHNVEGYLRAVLLDDDGAGSDLVRHVAAVEYELCREADLVLACSHEDRELFHRLYDIPFEKVLVVPNGAFTEQIRPAEPAAKAAAREKLGLSPGPVAVFVGSAYGPNVEAAEFIAGELAPALPHVTFVVCGGVGTALQGAGRAASGVQNVRVTGQLGEADKLAYFAAADVAINPMFSGSGTNIKMFDMMAAGLPVVATPTGARGITTGPDEVFAVCEKAEFVATLRRVVEDTTWAAGMGAAGRRRAAEAYSWERTCRALGRRLRRAHTHLGRPAPTISVVVATYERPDHLADLMDRLRAQYFRAFEVVVIDQSRQPWAAADRYSDLDLCYVHTDVKGAVKARNAGVFHARGEIIAFTDDDCQPHTDWLMNAHRYFDDPGVVGLEGLILSDKIGDPNYRTVTNQGFEGIGFMTANLFIRRATFAAVDGFDERFDNPHFREDTDLGWRALQLGQFPFGHDVRVFHPPHPREVERESKAERNRFFEKDALLLEKHPERYRILMQREGHYRHTPGFWENLLRGAAKYRIDLPVINQVFDPDWQTDFSNLGSLGDRGR